MSAGFHYDLNPAAVVEEICDVQTLHHKRGPYKLDTTGLEIGSKLPRFTPVQADLANRTVKVVKNVKVVEAAASNATTLKIAKGSLAAVGMAISTGAKSAVVSSIDKTNAAYDVLNLTAALGAAVAVGDVLYEGFAATVQANAAKDATTIKFLKGHGMKQGDIVSDGTTELTLGAIDTSNASYDSVTVEALASAVSKDTKFFKIAASGGAAVPAGTANFVIYEETKVESGIVLVALIMQAFEIQEDKLVLPVSAQDKEGLTARFQFE